MSIVQSENNLSSYIPDPSFEIWNIEQQNLPKVQSENTLVYYSLFFIQKQTYTISIDFEIGQK